MDENIQENAVIEQGSAKLGAKNWIIIWIAGLAGQLAWNIENQWFNTFVYAKVAPDPKIISWMVAVSAIVSTLSAFLAGTVGDRLGKRKPLIVTGYILWGVFTIAFGLTELVRFNTVMMFATAVVVADAMMSIFGSLGNDAGFNPWTTDISNEHNRGGLGAVIAIQPVLATIVGSLVGGWIVVALGYVWFFVIMGTFVIGVGVYCSFALKDAPTLVPNVDEKGFLHQFASAFNFKYLKNNKMLLVVLCIFSVFFISFNVYFPHILNYFIYARGYNEGTAGVLLGVGLILAIPFTILAGKFINKGKFVPVIALALISNMLGLLILALTASLTGAAGSATIMIGILFVGGGYMVIYQSLMIWCKNLYPEDMRGQLEGVRLFFYVCVPMVLGPALANPIINTFGKEITISYVTGSVEGHAPTEKLFYVALAVAAITYLPLYIAKRMEKAKAA